MYEIIFAIIKQRNKFTQHPIHCPHSKLSSLSTCHTRSTSPRPEAAPTAEGYWASVVQCGSLVLGVARCTYARVGHVVGRARSIRPRHEAALLLPLKGRVLDVDSECTDITCNHSAIRVMIIKEIFLPLLPFHIVVVNCSKFQYKLLAIILVFHINLL